MPTHFTIYAYDAIKAEFEHLDFLFGKPTFIRQLDPNKPAEKAFISNNGSQGKARIG